MTSLDRVVIVGASLAGLRAAETLRSTGYEGVVTLVGAEIHQPYDRPPLSKKLLAGEWQPERIRLRRPDAFDELDIDWRLGARAVQLDLDGRRIHLDDGTDLPAAASILATGASPRRLPGQSRFDHLHELRTLDDALRLREELADGDRRLVVVGAGFIGLEVAATARQLGNEVVVLEAAPAPLVRGLGAEMGAAVAGLHEAEGVEIRCGVTIDAIDERGITLDGDGVGVGERVDADVIVVGIGVVPNTDWLTDSGLRLDDGVVCDETLTVQRTDGTPVPGILAAGDVARWTNPLFGEEMRVEHWTNAAEQGALAATNLLDRAHGRELSPYAAVPFFWSDQYGHRIQFLGRSSADDEVVVAAGSVEGGKLLALYGAGGRLHGALGLNAPRWVMPMRQLLLDGASFDDARAQASEL